jgi:phytoene synthase
VSDALQDLVAKGDKDRYLSSLFAPQSRWPHLMALYAFNIEITRIRDTVSEPQLGLVRQQWWLDELYGIYAGRSPEHPLAASLANAIAFAKLPREPLASLIMAREFDLYDDVMPSLNDLEGYLGETSSVIMQLATMILGGLAPEVAGLAGVAFGIAGVLRSGRSIYVPADLVQASGEDAARMALCAHARKRLAEARAIGVSPDLLPAFLPASLTELYLSHLERKRPPEISQVRRQATLWWAARRNRF